MNKGSENGRGLQSTLQRISVILNHRALWMHESLFMENLRQKGSRSRGPKDE